MPELQIQLKRGEEWRKVTTVRYESDHDGRGGNRKRAILDGLLKLSDWRSSDQFTGQPMRLAEHGGSRGREHWRAITGVNG